MKDLGYTFSNLYSFAISLFKVFGKKFSYTANAMQIRIRTLKERRGEEGEGKGVFNIKPAQKYRSARTKKAKD